MFCSEFPTVGHIRVRVSKEYTLPFNARVIYCMELKPNNYSAPAKKSLNEDDHFNISMDESYKGWTKVTAAIDRKQYQSRQY